MTREEAKSRTRQRLLDAAERLFLESGYAATPMDHIAQEAGVTKAAIYRHFPSKEALFLALRERRSRIADVSPLEETTTSYEERLAAVGRNIARMAVDVDPRVLALQLEFRAVSLRRPDARERFADEIRSLAAAAATERRADDPVLRAGVTDAEVLVLGQLLVDGLLEYRAYVPDIVTEQTFATALGLIASLAVPPAKPPRRRRR